MSPRTPRNVIAVTPSGEITMDMILGFYALFTVPDAPVSAAKLRRLWMAEGLEEKLVPKNRRAVNTFQAACRAVETRRTITNGSTKDIEVKVDEVLENPAECVYQITRMVRDRESREIEFHQAMRVVFNKDDDAITDEAMGDRKSYRELKSLADDIREYFDKNASKVPGAKVRSAIRGTLHEHLSTNVQGKGVYFVPKAGRNALDSLQNVLNGLYGEAGGAEMHLIPCANAEGERKMVAKHFTANALSEADTLLAELSQRLREGKGARRDRRDNLVGQRRRLGDAAEKYKDMLDTNLDLLDEKMKFVDDALEKLLLEDS